VRDIGSRSTAGPEAVVCAAVDWWLTGFDLTGVVLSALEGADPAEMWSRRPEDLAAALSHRIPWDRVNQHFWRSAQGVPAVRHMVEYAVRAWRTKGGRVQEAKVFVASLILRSAGETVLASGYLEANSGPIAAARAARRRR
jgi:hypothetical protein